jgi:hypothetical protein
MSRRRLSCPAGGECAAGDKCATRDKFSGLLHGSFLVVCNDDITSVIATETQQSRKIKHLMQIKFVDKKYCFIFAALICFFDILNLIY